MVEGQMMRGKNETAGNPTRQTFDLTSDEGKEAGRLETIGSMKRFLGLVGISEKEMRDLKMANPLVLAFVGDAVYEHYVRMAVIHKTRGGLHLLHKQSTRYVRATAQAYVVKNLENFLTEEELDMIRKGRNQKGHSAPKNTETSDYRLATGFETLIGYLSLREDTKRLEEVVAKAMEIVDQCSVLPVKPARGVKAVKEEQAP